MSLIRACVKGHVLFSRSSTVVIMVGIWVDNSLLVTETHSDFRHPFQQPPGNFMKREEKKKTEDGGWGEWWGAGSHCNLHRLF